MVTYDQEPFNQVTGSVASFKAFETAGRICAARNVKEAAAALKPEQQHGEQVGK